MSFIRVILVLALVATAARAEGQDPLTKLSPLPEYHYNLYPDAKREAEERSQQIQNWVNWGQKILIALLVGAGTVAGRNKFRGESKVVKASQRAHTANLPPPLPLAATEPSDPRECPDTSLPTESRAEVLLPVIESLMSCNRTSENQLIGYLGEPTRTFRPSLPMAALRIFLSTFFTGLVTLIILAITQVTPTNAPVIFWLALFLVVLSGPIYLVVWALLRHSLRVLICPGGIIQIARGKVAGAFWEQIRQVEFIKDEQAEAGANRQICVAVRNDGFQFVFKSYHPKNVSTLAKIIASHLR